MRLKRFVVSFCCFALLFMQSAGYAQSPHDQGVASGNAANTVIRTLINGPSATTVVPGYTTTPPETAYAGRPSLGADANAKLAACAATPTNPTCQGLLNAVNSANTPRAAISSSDPSVASASRIYRNPSTDLGSVAAYYSGCTTSEVTSPPRIEMRACSRFVGVGSQSCSDKLTVDVGRSFNCNAGEWFAHASDANFGLDAQCIPDRPDKKQHFRVTDSGNPSAFFDVDMTVTSILPRKAAQLETMPSHSVYAAGRSCTGGSCSLQAVVAENERKVCTDPFDESTCVTEYPFLEVYSSCPAGTQSGNNLLSTVCTGSGEGIICTSSPLSQSRCYSPNPAGTPAVDLTGTYGDLSWSPTSDRAVVGWIPNPTFGPIWSMTVGYPKPASNTNFADSWNNQCPSLGPGGRCSMTSPRQCVDGPSARMIGGVSVSRDCWEYQSTISCTDGSGLGECASLAASGCSLGSSTCKRFNAVTGLCQEFRDQYSCAVPGETVTTVSSCPSNVFCLGTSCFNTTYAQDADLARSVSVLESSREGAAYLDTNRMRLFIGSRSQCSRSFSPSGLEVADCCKADGSFGGYSNQSLFGGSMYMYDSLFTMDNAQFIYQALASMVAGGEVTGSFSAFGVTVSVGTEAVAAAEAAHASGEIAGSLYVADSGTVAVGFDPWTIVIMIIILLIIDEISCDAPEEIHNLREGAGLCHQVGSHCVRFHPFPHNRVCRKRNWSYCCFNSMLSRIINEQGRPQIGKSWGSSTDPECSGFTVAELQRLNFAAMDFTEFYASIAPKLPNTDLIRSGAAARADYCYYGHGRCR
jgi:conjugal transfer mating pair stabilization protein TraN